MLPGVTLGSQLLLPITLVLLTLGDRVLSRKAHQLAQGSPMWK